jgi:hypothetical protein
MERHHIGIALAIALLVGAGWYFMMSREAVAPLLPDENAENGERSEAEDSPEPTAGMRIGEYAVYAPDQQPGASVIVPLVALGAGGFVVIHADQGGAPGAILGASQLLAEGEHERLTVPLSRPSRDGEALYARLYIDDGDGAFMISKDQPALDPMEQPVTMQFSADADADPPPEVSI